MLPKGVEIVGRKNTGFEEVLAPEAVAFVAELAREFEEERQRLLEHRRQRRARIAAGERPTFPPETEGIRRSEWRVAPPPPDLQTRWVEITGPTDRKMIINALNSGAQVFMADFEDANVPTWSNLIEGQQNLREAVRRTIRYTAPDGRIYRLGGRIGTLVGRPPGGHPACGWTAGRWRGLSSTWAFSCITTPTRSWSRGAAPISICRNWKVTGRRDGGIRSARLPRIAWGSPEVPCGSRC